MSAMRSKLRIRIDIYQVEMMCARWRSRMKTFSLGSL